MLEYGTSYLRYWESVFKEKSKRDRLIAKCEKRKIVKRRNVMLKRMASLKKELHKKYGKRRVGKL